MAVYGAVRDAEEGAGVMDEGAKGVGARGSSVPKVSVNRAVSSLAFAVAVACVLFIVTPASRSEVTLLSRSGSVDHLDAEIQQSHSHLAGLEARIHHYEDLLKQQQAVNDHAEDVLKDAIDRSLSIQKVGAVPSQLRSIPQAKSSPAGRPQTLHLPRHTLQGALQRGRSDEMMGWNKPRTGGNQQQSLDMAKHPGMGKFMGILGDVKKDFAKMSNLLQAVRTHTLEDRPMTTKEKNEGFEENFDDMTYETESPTQENHIHILDNLSPSYIHACTVDCGDNDFDWYDKWLEDGDKSVVACPDLEYGGC